MNWAILAGFTGFLVGVLAGAGLKGASPVKGAVAEPVGGSAQGGVVTGIGGVFFKSANPDALYAWYETHLGIRRTPVEGYVNFCWRDAEDQTMARTVWGPFREDTTYFDPGKRDIMMNFRVAGLDALLARLKAAGVTVFEEIEEYEYGRFAWILDLEGNKVELWEPHESDYDWRAVCLR